MRSEHTGRKIKQKEMKILMVLTFHDRRSAVAFESVEGHLCILADLDEVAVGITHVAAPFPAVIVERLSKKDRSFIAPLLVAGPDVGDTQVKEAIHLVE